MREGVSAAELRAWLEAQQIANERGRVHVASMSAGEKLRAISRLMASAGLFDLSRREKGDALERDLWHRLRSLGSSLE